MECKRECAVILDVVLSRMSCNSPIILSITVTTLNSSPAMDAGGYCEEGYGGGGSLSSYSSSLGKTKSSDNGGVLLASVL